MRKLLPYFLAFLFALGFVVPADAQRRSSSSKRSSSSRSKSSSGSVHVKGYYRKDGTYVRPHYRTRPDGIVSNNWSFRGNVNPYTGLIGTKDYPLGVWADPSDKSSTYNTPFLGLTADYEAHGEGLLVKNAAPTSKVKKGWRVRRYRFSKQTVFTEVESWHDLSAEAMDSGDRKIVLRGTKDDGKDWEEEIDIQGPDAYFGPDGEGEDESTDKDAGEWYDLDDSEFLPVFSKGVGSFFVNVIHQKGSVPAVVDAADKSTNLEKGLTVVGIRMPADNEMTPVSTWSDVAGFILVHRPLKVAVRVKDKDNKESERLVLINRREFSWRKH